MTNNMPIFNVSGIRGIYGKELNYDIAKKIGIAYGLWLGGKNKKVLIGMDTRKSGEILKKAIISGLIHTNCKIIDLGICASPVIMFAKNKLHVSGGIIISGSHNPPEWNALKLLSSKTLLNSKELNEIYIRFNNIELNNYQNNDFESSNIIKKFDAVPLYLRNLYRKINLKNIIYKNSLRILVDSGAGAGKYVTPFMLKNIGCEVKCINNNLNKNQEFPRGLDPTEENLQDLINSMKNGNYDVGFAHDCDADRLAIVGDNAKYYQLDIGLALIADNYFKYYAKKKRRTIFVTNLASSLIFDKLAEKYNAQIMRTPIGELYLAETMENLILKNRNIYQRPIIFGGEGSCGGVMIPDFNNTRDGIFAAAKIVEILIETNEKISKLVSQLPKFYKCQENVIVYNNSLEVIINKTNEQLMNSDNKYNQIGMDIRINYGNDAFVLIHPSNTEPLIRVISEAKTEELAKTNLNSILRIINLVKTKNLNNSQNI